MAEQKSKVERFDIPTGGRTPLEVFRAMRAYFEKVAESQGKKLSPGWYDDGPEAKPGLYKQQSKKD